MDQIQRKPEEATTKVIRLNQEKKITHFGRCFVEVHLKDKQLILKAPDSSLLFTSNFDPIIFIKRHNFLFAVDTLTFNDYVLVCPTTDVCTQVLDAIKRWKAMEATNDMMEEYFFKHHFYIPIFDEVKAGIAGADEMKADILELVVLLNPQKCQEYMHLALKILDVPQTIPPAYQHQVLNAQMGDPTNSFDNTVFSGSHLSDTVALVDGMNPESAPGRSDEHSSLERSLQNVSCDDAIPTAHQHQASNYPTENSSSSDITVFSDSRLFDTSSLVDGMNPEAAPGRSDERSSLKRSSQNVSCDEYQAIPSAHRHVQDQVNYEIQGVDPTEHSSSSDNTVLHDSHLSDASSLVDGLNVTSHTVQGSSNERSSRKRKLQNVSYEGMEASSDCDEGESSNRRKKLIVADESRIVKLPHFKLYQKQWGRNMSKRLVIFDSSNPLLGYEFGFRHAQNDYYCWECKNQFETLVCAKLVEDENANYIQFGTRDHKCNLKMLKYNR